MRKSIAEFRYNTWNHSASSVFSRYMSSSWMIWNNAFCWNLFLNNDIIFLCPPLYGILNVLPDLLYKMGTTILWFFPSFFQIFFHFPWKISLFARLCLLSVQLFYKFFAPLHSLSPLCYKGFLCLCACSIIKKLSNVLVFSKTTPEEIYLLIRQIFYPFLLVSINFLW